MFQLRIHGRGGQGVVTAAELVSIAAFVEGRHAQAFPSFGSERAGAPVVLVLPYRRPARFASREPISEPDALIIQDPTLLHQVDVFGGLSDDGFILINSSRGLEELGLGELYERFRPSGCSPCRRRTSRASTSAGRFPTRSCWVASRRSRA